MAVQVQRMMVARFGARAAGARPMPDTRSTPTSGLELPLSGTVEWHAASHCVVVNKSRLPQNFGNGLVLSQLLA
jgi:hypothetical protein